jgi:hypothetical protein
VADGVFADDGAVEGELDSGADDGHVDLGSLVGVPDVVVGAGEADRAGAVHHAPYRRPDRGGPWRPGPGSPGEGLLDAGRVTLGVGGDEHAAMADLHESGVDGDFDDLAGQLANGASNIAPTRSSTMNTPAMTAANATVHQASVEWSAPSRPKGSRVEKAATARRVK